MNQLLGFIVGWVSVTQLLRHPRQIIRLSFTGVQAPRVVIRSYCPRGKLHRIGALFSLAFVLVATLTGAPALSGPWMALFAPGFEMMLRPITVVRFLTRGVLAALS